MGDSREPGQTCTDAGSSALDAKAEPSPQAKRVDAAADAQPVPGDLIGRFVVIRVLGSGGMGVVLLAYDVALNRNVALKLLRSDLRAGEQSDTRTARLLREAQAMAQIAHRNVVSVYEVGTAGEQVYIAMEHVDGETLSSWLSAPRPWRTIVAAFAEAAHGLHAAHVLGMVHRDFKPENVFVAKDGRVLVGDFGLVGVAAQAEDEEPGLAHGSVSPFAGAVGLTRDGTMLGTPGYSAPEQVAGKPVDARADQYAFCVALDEALGSRA